MKKAPGAKARETSGKSLSPIRVLTYLLGLIVMALGIVLIKRAALGMSPISSIPSALANVTRFSLGNTTIAFHVLCAVMQAAVLRRVTLKTLLLLPLAVVFGYLIDLLMLLIAFGEMAFWLRCVITLFGIGLTALGIVVIAETRLMLPAPDSFLQALSGRLKKPLGRVKIMGDLVWVAVSVAIELPLLGRAASVGLGTVASVYLTGKLMEVLRPRLRRLQVFGKNA